jgi:hypothetical protein
MDISDAIVPTFFNEDITDKAVHDFFSSLDDLQVFSSSSLFRSRTLFGGEL